MIGILDYVNIAYLVILFLTTALLRRYSDSKLLAQLSYAVLLVACLSTLAFFTLFYLTVSHERFYGIYFSASILTLVISVVIVYFKNEFLDEKTTETNEKDD